MNDIQMQELRQRCRELDREIRIEKMELIEGIMNRIVMGSVRNLQKLDWLITQRDALVKAVKWY